MIQDDVDAIFSSSIDREGGSGRILRLSAASG